MALTPPAGMNAQLVCIPILCRDVATTTTSAGYMKPGFAGRIVGINAVQSGVAGTQPTVDVELRTGYSTYAVAAAARVVAGSALIIGGTIATLATTNDDLAFSATDVLKADITVTGTSTVTQTMVYVFAVRE